jgi:hypothetical protein
VTFATLVRDFLGTHWTYHPVDATFAGVDGYDGSLPPADGGVTTRYAKDVRALRERLDAIAVPDDAGARLDARHMRARIAHVEALLECGMPYANPAWYTGEAAFGIISLLLKRTPADDPRPMTDRLDAMPDFFGAASRRLADIAVPTDWCRRADNEARAFERILASAACSHAAFDDIPGAAVGRAIHALRSFRHAIAALPDREPAFGEAHLAGLMRDVHGLSETPLQLEARAAEAFARVRTELDAAAARLDPHADRRDVLDRLAKDAPAVRDLLPTYRYWHDRALAEATPLVTPAATYALTFDALPGWARAVAGDLYFLFYRSPAAFAPGAGSTYWVDVPVDVPTDAPAPGQNVAAIKMIHAVHHGSVGHHTQNAYARTAASAIARIAGTDCASGIAMLSAGTMAEGWACYAEDLMAEIDGFYTPLERLQLTYFELRNIGCCLADLRLHLGTWSLDEMRAFYRDEVGFAESRIWSETTRNSMFPASRLMYWTGSQQIAALRAESPLGARAFHDRLLSFGSTPVAWIAEELRR